MISIEKQSIKILVVEKNKSPILKKVPNNLESFRRIIGNKSIELELYKGAILVYDMQSLSKNLPVTRYVDTENGKKAIRGTFFDGK